MNESQLVFSIMMMAAGATVVFGVAQHRAPQTVMTVSPATIANTMNLNSTPIKYFNSWTSESRDPAMIDRLDDAAAIERENTAAAFRDDEGGTGTMGILERVHFAPQVQLSNSSPSIQGGASAVGAGGDHARIALPAEYNEPNATGLLEWTAAPAEWSPAQFNLVGMGAGNAKSSPMSFSSLKPVSIHSNGQWKSIDSSIATGWLAAPAGAAAKAMRTRAPSTLVKPARMNGR